MSAMQADGLRSRRDFLRSFVDGAVRRGRALALPWRSRSGRILTENTGQKVAGPEADRARTGGCATSGEVLAALNDLSGIYEP